MKKNMLSRVLTLALAALLALSLFACGKKSDDNSTGVAVDSVAEGGRKAVFGGGVILPFFIQIALDSPDEGVALSALILVHHQARLFVGQQEIFVLIDDIQLPLCSEEGEGGRFLWREKLIIDIKLDEIPRGQNCIVFRPLSVDFDPLDADIALKQPSGQSGGDLFHKAVQPLARIVLIDRKSLHRFPPFTFLSL